MVYMIHLPIIAYIFYAGWHSQYVTFMDSFFFTVGTTIISFLLAIPCSMFWEVPYMHLEKLLLMPKWEELRTSEKKLVVEEVDFKLDSPIMTKGESETFKTSLNEYDDETESVS